MKPHRRETSQITSTMNCYCVVSFEMGDKSVCNEAAGAHEYLEREQQIYTIWYSIFGLLGFKMKCDSESFTKRKNMD